MKLTIRNAHPQGRGRMRNVPVTVSSIGSSGVSVPHEVDSVSVALTCDDGVDISSSTRYSFAFTIDDAPDTLDKLIGMLTDLRTHQQRVSTSKKKSPCNRCHSIFTGVHTWEECLAAMPFNSPEAWR